MCHWCWRQLIKVCRLVEKCTDSFRRQRSNLCSRLLLTVQPFVIDSCSWSAIVGLFDLLAVFSKHLYILYFFTLPAGVVVKYSWVCLSVGLSARISLEPLVRSYQIFLCMLPMSMARSSSGMFTIGRIAGKGFSSPLKMHYQPRKGDGSAQRGRSMLSTIALFVL